MPDTMLSRIKLAWTTNRKHVANFASFLLLRLLALGAFAVSVPIFINNASEAGYGVIAIGFSLLGLNTVLDVGIGYVVTQLVGRRVARQGSNHPKAFNHLLWLYIFGACLVTGLSLTAVILTPLSPREQFFYGCLVCLLPFLAVSGTATAVFQAHGDLVYLNASRFLFEIGKGIAVALSGLWFADYVAVGPLLLGCAFLRAGLDVHILKVRLGYRLRVPERIMSRNALRLASHGMFSMGAAMLMVAVHILDKVLIANWLTREDVAHYSIAFDVNTKAYVLVHALNSTMLTILLHKHARRVESRRNMTFALAVVLAVAVCYYLPIGIWGAELISLWVNPDVASGTAPLLRVMAGASVLYLFGSVFEIGLLARAAPRVVFIVTLSAVSSYAVALMSFPSKMGATGFMWAYLALCSVYLVGMVAGHFKYPGVTAPVREV